ncbi:MAG TPA: MBL fold metallo-hydrolase [Gaiellaceae bacterium]|nr:MBL fold metallo-hydrolase [Gaiellaceae bacterium]
MSERTRICVLGSGGWIPTERRETCCVLLVKGRTGLVLDAGSGVRRLLDRPDLLSGVEELHIVLSHFHLDHLVGLGYLPAFPADRELVLWGPGRALYDAPTRAVLGRMFRSPFFTPGVRGLSERIRDLDEGANHCNGITLVARRQSKHAEPTFAFRIDDSVVYCSDTALDEGNVKLARGASVLLHEAWTPERSADATVHTSAREAAALARRAEAHELVLVHVNPFADEAALLASARDEFPATRLGTDLLTIDVH